MTRGDQQIEIRERGNIYFFYRPKVRSPGEKSHTESLAEVQRTYMVLSPHGRKLFRVLVIGRKFLPGIAEQERNWGFVEKVYRDPRAVEQEFKRDLYETRTRGERVLPSARPAGEGVYAIATHGNHTHLVYQLELPGRPGEVQHELKIEPEGSYIITVKNPEASAPPGVGLTEEQKAELPERLQARFHSRRFIPADPPELLDHEETELILIGAHEDISQELGLDLHPQDEDERTAEIFNELKLSKPEHRLEPLFEGKWE